MSWRARAACIGCNPDLFFPERGDHSRDINAAKQVCLTCPMDVRVECLRDVLNHGGHEPGIRAGFTQHERKLARMFDRPVDTVVADYEAGRVQVRMTPTARGSRPRHLVVAS